jgi:sugar phosphate isomerase/epimerase
MLHLGFVTAILPDLELEDVLSFAAQERFACVEVMCWPRGKADRRYAGVTHIDVVDFTSDDAKRVEDLCAAHGVAISGLGYYPNPLVADGSEAAIYTNHLRAVISAARLLNLRVVNTFVGRDHTKSVDDNWPRFLSTWKPLIEFAEGNGINIGIENCPMSFTKDEWPGGKNLASSPAIWRRMFNDIPSANFGLNYDPSHFVWQGMDYIGVLREFQSRLHHIHAKDARLDRDRLNEVGALAYPNLYHTPKLPGMGDVDWGAFLGVLAEVYSGPVAIEVEDRAYEGSLEARKRSLSISANYLRAFTG